MSEGFTKLFASIIHSTVWQEDAFVKVTWITMLAMADRHGVVGASVPGLAKAAGVPLDACEAALSKFMSPDPYSRSPEFQGRRIEKVDGGWRLLNHPKYRRLMAAEDKAEKHAARQARYVSKRQQASAVTPNDANDPIAEAEAESDPKAEAEGEKIERPGKRAPVRKSTIPDGFCLTPNMAEYAKGVNGWEPQRIADVFEAFLLDAQAHRRVYANWIAAWQGWVRRQPGFDRPSGKYQVDDARKPLIQRDEERPAWLPKTA